MLLANLITLYTRVCSSFFSKNIPSVQYCLIFGKRSINRRVSLFLRPKPSEYTYRINLQNDEGENKSYDGAQSFTLMLQS